MRVLSFRTRGHSEASATYSIVKNFCNDGGDMLFIVIDYCDECLTSFGVSYLLVCLNVVELVLFCICDLFER